MRVCWNRQTGTFEVRVSKTCGFKSRHSHQNYALMRLHALRHFCFAVLIYPRCVVHRGFRPSKKSRWDFSAETSALRARFDGLPSNRTLVRIDVFFASGRPRQKSDFKARIRGQNRFFRQAEPSIKDGLAFNFIRPCFRRSQPFQRERERSRPRCFLRIQRCPQPLRYPRCRPFQG